MGRHDVPRGRRGPQIKSRQRNGGGGTSVGGTKEKGFTGWGHRGAEGPEGGTAALATRPVPTALLTHRSSRAEGGLTCQQDAERQKAKKTPTARVGHRAAPGRGHLASRLSGSLPSPPARQWPL